MACGTVGFVSYVPGHVVCPPSFDAWASLWASRTECCYFWGRTFRLMALWLPLPRLGPVLSADVFSERAFGLHLLVPFGVGGLFPPFLVCSPVC